MRHQRLLLWFILVIFSLATAAHAQDEPRHVIQRHTGYLHAGDAYIFHITDLAAGDTVYFALHNVSGNLDPVLHFGERDFEEPLIEDDDSGPGYDAALSYTIETAGDYDLVITNHGGDTFGEYLLWMGLNAPEVLEDEAPRPTRQTFASLDVERSAVSLAVQEFTSVIDDPNHAYEHELTHLNAGHTLYVYAIGTSGDFIPHVELMDFSRKVLATADADPTTRALSFSYAITETGDHYNLYVGSREGTTGSFRLLVGVDSPTVLEGEAHRTGDPLIREAITIQTGVELLQITNVDQQAKNFTVVANLHADWIDHEQAFDPADCQCHEHAYVDDEVRTLLVGTAIRWPNFQIVNQQNPRTTQSRSLVIRDDGHIQYIETFSVVLQAPEFDFRAFPFDHQDFWLRLQTRFHDDVFVLAVHDDPSANQISAEIGEEEWVITDTAYSTIHTPDGYSQFTFDLKVERHVNYYFYRILIPLALILLVGWAIFFIDNVDTRIGASSGNLLIFIAFNFTIASDLPRLGYLTFMDMWLISCFVATTVVFAANVYVRRLENINKAAQGKRITRLFVWGYPAFFALMAVYLSLAYLS